MAREGKLEREKNTIWREMFEAMIKKKYKKKHRQKLGKRERMSERVGWVYNCGKLWEGRDYILSSTNLLACDFQLI